MAKCTTKFNYGTLSVPKSHEKHWLASLRFPESCEKIWAATLRFPDWPSDTYDQCMTKFNFLWTVDQNLKMKVGVGIWSTDNGIFWSYQCMTKFRVRWTVHQNLKSIWPTANGIFWSYRRKTKIFRWLLVICFSNFGLLSNGHGIFWSYRRKTKIFRWLTR